MEDRKEFIDGIKSRFEHLKSERRKREGDWKEVQRYVAPSVFDWDNPGNKNPKRPSRFTSKPTNFLKQLRSGITGYSISPNIAWMKLGLENFDAAKARGVKDWLEEAEKAMFAEFNRSNLYQQTSKFIEFSATYGHGAMLIDERIGDGRIRFSNINTQELFLDTDEYDEPDAVFRRYNMTLKNASAFFGEENLKDSRRGDLKDPKKWNVELTVLHAVFKREGAGGESASAKKKPYASVYIDTDQDHLMTESGYDEFPYSVFIWDRINGTAYGESPAIHALDDIKNLNVIDEALMKVTQYSAEPALNVPDDMREEVNVVPAGHNYYKDREKIIYPINTGANYPVTLETRRDIENRVRDHFHVDFFLSLLNERPSNVTATYVMELQSEKAAVLSDLVVNLNRALAKVVQRSFNILWKQGKIPEPPEAVKGTGASMKVDFIGPLAQAQKKFHESAGIQQGIQLIGAVGQMSPASLDVVDFDETLKQGLNGYGFPQVGIREARDVEKMREERARHEEERAREEQAMGRQRALMGNYDKLNEPVKPGSPIDEMNKMRGGMA